MCKHANDDDNDDDTTFIKRVTVRGEWMDERRQTVIRTLEIDEKIIYNQRLD